ncbi:MAG: hypothetical protein WBU92_03140 [Candidatus Dormiibacterota bacterium]
MRRALRAVVAGGALAVALMAVPQAVAKGGPPSGGGGTDTVNNLSVPAIFIGPMTPFPGLTCPGGPTAPQGTPVSGYYTQGTDTWQAQCDTVGSASGVSAKWGDNLASPQPKSGTPIQVQVSLTKPVTAPMVGYEVVNLTPTKTDRDSTYGTTGTPVDFTTVGVWDSAATLSIVNKDAGTTVFNGSVPSEVNSTGAVVYSFGWGTDESGSAPAVAGNYTLTFTSPNISFTGGGDSVSIDVTVAEANGHGGGGGGGTEATNNLSVPTTFIGDMTPFTGLTCPSGPIAPVGTLTDGYYIQGQATWQAQCVTAESASNVTAKWGDNLSSPQPKAGTPIRVEVAMTMPVTPAMVGYMVENLTPDVADRNATYGTTGTPVDSSTGGVWDASATMSIVNDDTMVTLYSGPPSSEINSLGQVVYGFNWGTGKGGSPAVAAGNYTLTFTAPNVTLTGGGHTITLNLTVPEDHSGGGGGGGGGETEATNNLSVPTIFVPDASPFTGITCPSAAVAPTGTTMTTSGGTYFVQGQATWQAQCDTAAAASNVTAKWGDNLSTNQPKAGSPIQVEVSLTKPVDNPMVGYAVEDLTPNLSDQDSTYGSIGTPVNFSTVGVWVAGATLSIVDDATGMAVYSGPATAEINSTGQVVYSYSWGTGNSDSPDVAAGNYTLTFTAPNLALTGGGNSISRELTVPESNGGGGGGQGGRTIANHTIPSGEVSIDSVVYDTATLSDSASYDLGTVTYMVYSDAVCSDPVANITPADNQVVDGVVPNSDPISFTSPGTYYFQSTFTSDDITIDPISSPCGSQKLVVSKKSPSVSTQTVPASPVSIGTSVRDTATLSNATSDAGGTVTYGLYSDNLCKELVQNLTPTDNQVVDGAVPDSKSYTFTSAGTWYFQATYSGDRHNTGPVSSNCALETVVVNQNTPSVSLQTDPTSPVGVGTAVHASATLSNATGNAGGSVTYGLYSDSSCKVLVQGLTPTDNQVVDGAVPDSNSHTFTSAGTWYFQVTYSGDQNNTGPVSSNCAAAAITVNAPAGGVLGASILTPFTGAAIGVGAAILLLGALLVGFGTVIRRRRSRIAD